MRGFEFLGQKLSSDYCAVYAAAMWLSLMGCATTRAESHLAFGTGRSGWAPPDEAAVTEVLRRRLGEHAVRRTTHRYSSSAALVAAGRRRLADSSALIVAATCRLRGTRVAARHAFLITGVEKTSLRILDSLGPAPMSGHLANALISDTGARQRFLPAAGTCWDVDLAGPIAFIGRCA